MIEISMIFEKIPRYRVFDQKRIPSSNTGKVERNSVEKNKVKFVSKSFRQKNCSIHKIQTE
jgi:hypothetical protein